MIDFLPKKRIYEKFKINNSWKSFAQSLFKMRVDAPELKGGVIRAGGCLGDTWGAMTTVKKN